MTRLELRVVVAAVLAATVVLGAVVCAAYGLTIVASAMSIYALGVGAWLYHAIERLILARRISTVRTAAKPLQPLLPVMAAIMGLTQAWCARWVTSPICRHAAGSFRSCRCCAGWTTPGIGLIGGSRTATT